MLELKSLFILSGVVEWPKKRTATLFYVDFRTQDMHYCPVLAGLESYWERKNYVLVETTLQVVDCNAFMSITSGRYPDAKHRGTEGWGFNINFSLRGAESDMGVALLAMTNVKTKEIYRSVISCCRRCVPVVLQTVDGGI
ncbi:MAG: hypothetical protein KOO62_11010 [candidate division Zixibacteria bacterium]|nr:hypothetical protein [candidate division Zixibacteria bacterium]